MRSHTRIAAAVAALALAVPVGAGIAQAAQSGGGGGAGLMDARGPGHGPSHGPRHGGPVDLAAVSSYLGLTAAELRTQLGSGKSLADVAKAQGKTVAGLEDAIVAAAKGKLDAAVADGKLTAAQAAEMLTRLKADVGDIVERTGPPAGHGKGGPGKGGPVDFAAVSSYLGLTAAELRTQLSSGKSLADVARAQGKAVAGLEDAIVAAAKGKLDTAVADGKLTAAQAAEMLTRLKADVDEIVERTGPPPRHGHGPRAGA